jgi:hypothetical protein
LNNSAENQWPSLLMAAKWARKTFELLPVLSFVRAMGMVQRSEHLLKILLSPQSAMQLARSVISRDCSLQVCALPHVSSFVEDVTRSRARNFEILSRFVGTILLAKSNGITLAGSNSSKIRFDIQVETER